MAIRRVCQRERHSLLRFTEGSEPHFFEPGPLLIISLGHFDDEVPAVLMTLVAKDPAAKPERKSPNFPLRKLCAKRISPPLAITKFLNDPGPHDTYAETLRLDVELRALYRTVCRTLQGFNSSNGPFALSI